MNVGVLQVKLHFPENQSLKGKRQIVKSIISRLRHQYNVSVAEVDAQDLWQIVVLGITCVSNHNQQISEILSQIISFVVRNYPELELVDHEMEIFPV